MPALEEYNRPAVKARIATRSKLSKSPRLYSFVKSLFKLYCRFTYFLHSDPDFLVIGTARSASTSLYQYLIQHPCVGACLTKQPHFFDKHFNKGIEWYKIFFPNIFTKFYKTNILRTKFVTGEATVHYILHPLAPKRVAKMYPKIKLIVILRNPVDRAYSHYQTELSNKSENLSFEKAIKVENKRLEDEFEKLAEDRNYESKNYPHRAYITSGIYVEQLKRWLEYFSMDQFLILSSEDFIINPSEQFKKILDFLNLPPFDLPNYKKIHSRNYRKINLETRKKLLKFYEPYNKQLYELTGKDFHWEN